MHPIPLTWNEALSGVAGSVSVASWVFLLIPQLAQNHRQGSAQGISLTFLSIWFLGDMTNLAGALWAGLVPTVVATAVYFCISDIILILQCTYYNSLNNRRAPTDIPTAAQDPASLPPNDAQDPSESTPLLPPSSTSSHSLTRRVTDITDENLGLPGSRRRRSSASSTHARARRQSTAAAAADGLSRIPEAEGQTRAPPRTRTWVRNALAILMVVAVGAAAWALAWRVGAWRPTPTPGERGGGGRRAGGGKTPVGAELLGYASAVLYLGARIPQIVKNQRERSCDGLSLLFFLLSLMGNATYGAGILFHSVQREYVLTNLPWLIGSLGTMIEDAIIFVQFSVFGEREEGVVVD